MTDDYLPKSATEYITCFRQLAAISENAMDYVASNLPAEPKSLERLAESVETIAGLRGDSGIYQGSRPDGLVEYQKEMYATENYLRERLLGLGYKYPVR